VADLNCEQCLRLWAEYGLAVRQTPNPAILKAILSRIEAHEAEAHQKSQSAKA